MLVSLAWFLVSLWSPLRRLFLDFLSGNLFHHVFQGGGRNQGVQSTGAISDSGDTLGMTKTLRSIGHNGAQTGEMLLLRSRTYSDDTISPTLLYLLRASHCPLERSFPPSALQGHLSCSRPKFITTSQSWLTCPPAEDSRRHGGFKLHLCVWNEPPEVSSICLNLRRARTAVLDPTMQQI